MWWLQVFSKFYDSFCFTNIIIFASYIEWHDIFQNNLTSQILENWSHRYQNVIFHLISQESSFNLSKKSAWVMLFFVEHLNRIGVASWKSCNAHVHNTFCRSPQIFAHIMTVILSWPVQNFVVIGWIYLKPEHSKFDWISNLIEIPLVGYYTWLGIWWAGISRSLQTCILDENTFYATIHACPCP